MRRTRNADDFLLEFRRLRSNYVNRYKPLVDRVRREFAERNRGTVSQLTDELLEAHSRTYVVNSFLAALNWRLDTNPETGLPNLIPEAQVEVQGVRRFLDYLGLESATKRPLMVVETKRPSAPVPKLKASGRSTGVGDIPSTLARALSGETLLKPWVEWLEDVRGYVQGVAAGRHAPQRVLVTNGDWLIVFLNPSGAFIAPNVPSATDILFFPNPEDIEKRSGELFLALEHERVLGESRDLTVGEVPFHFGPESIERAMHGLRVRYIEQPNVHGQYGPVIRVAPIMLLKSRFGGWVRIGINPTDFVLPERPSDLPAHLDEVRNAAGQLRTGIAQRLGRNLEPQGLREHYGNADSFSMIRGVLEVAPDQFVLATGADTHFVHGEPSVPNCPFHDWRRAHGEGCAGGGAPISIRQVLPQRAFFRSEEAHHCAHRDVASAKASFISAENRDRCGPRSGADGAAFCEVWKFETHLCCRTCAYEEVCTKATVFKLPCQRP